jgi:4-diphosphocytidyl-2-C-methyl-D-erythritol kinase
MVNLKSPAKINLRLEVLGRLPNKYHLLRMFNLTVDLCDQIKIDFRAKQVTVEVDDPLVPGGTKNFAYKAADYFQRKFKVDFGARIKIQKKVPVGGGMGGGSGNAATVLAALLRKYKIKQSVLDLEEVAYHVGADVPYLLSGGPAWVSGIGEKIEPVPDFPELFFLLAKPDFSVSTTEIYRSLKPGLNLTSAPKAVILSQLARGDWGKFCINHLEKVVFAKHPELSEMKSEIIRLGADAAVMSGSGSTLVGIFSDREPAARAARKLKQRHKKLWIKLVSQYQPEHG